MKLMQRAHRSVFAGALALASAGLAPDSAFAAETDLPHAGPGPAPQWHGDIHHFPEHDWHTWRGGHWVHGPHMGRLGWWWVVGSVWYFYPAPVYPYPNPYEPPPVVLVTPPKEGPPPPPTQYWYYCEATKGYYPYVPTCPSGWKQVPATPSDQPK
ncbi:MAG TPA: hypothetical protein VLW55_18655 [Burkholderiaceae bacterium]|nr:hypothetical protein [Burkholderiaceae bacterium]